MPPEKTFKRWPDSLRDSCFVRIFSCEPRYALLNLFLECVQEGVGIVRRRERLDRKTIGKRFCRAVGDAPGVTTLSLVQDSEAHDERSVHQAQRMRMVLGYATRKVVVVECNALRIKISVRFVDKEHTHHSHNRPAAFEVPSPVINVGSERAIAIGWRLELLWLGHDSRNFIPNNLANEVGTESRSTVHVQSLGGNGEVKRPAFIVVSRR